ncbi:DUF402 domain-containing protein [Carboxydochorda subterranea]|uniref:DUF402 domain-containing protein n=1 Tax=Carboxydichorda subterranea TaxID=3109565 RepID=A0ABZ1BXR5_9FIRM|nr:DUF402 domain-containing protein [Limnochorda sp. L945t]WRP17300.1 DUF402 domain-containing protein [Limnochorda sp. L945t]
MRDRVRVQALKYDGTVYRWWDVTVERRVGTLIVTFNPPGHLVFDATGPWAARVAVRAYYWLDRPYNVLETFRPDGAPEELYINVASPASWHDGVLSFRDFELDVVKRPGLPATIVDQDEFEEACRRYAYPSHFIAHCRAVAEEACRVAEGWVWSRLEHPAVGRWAAEPNPVRSCSEGVRRCGVRSGTG